MQNLTIGRLGPDLTLGSDVSQAREHARLSRAVPRDQVDTGHVAEEIEVVGESKPEQLVSRVAFLLAALLKFGRDQLGGIVFPFGKPHEYASIALCLLVLLGGAPMLFGCSESGRVPKSQDTLAFGLLASPSESPVIGVAVLQDPLGGVAAITKAGTIFSIGPKGQIRWSKTVSSMVPIGVASGPPDRLLISLIPEEPENEGKDAPEVLALDAEGNIRWRLSGSTHGTIASVYLSPDGRHALAVFCPLTNPEAEALWLDADSGRILSRERWTGVTFVAESINDSLSTVALGLMSSSERTDAPPEGRLSVYRAAKLSAVEPVSSWVIPGVLADGRVISVDVAGRVVEWVWSEERVSVKEKGSIPGNLSNLVEVGNALYAVQFVQNFYDEGVSYEAVLYELRDDLSGILSQQRILSNAQLRAMPVGDTWLAFYPVAEEGGDGYLVRPKGWTYRLPEGTSSISAQLFNGMMPVGTSDGRILLVEPPQ